MLKLKENMKIIDRDVLKYIALIPMSIGHFLGYFMENIWGDSDVPSIILLITNASIFAPPVFFFFISEGFRYTRSQKRYAIRLLVFALINQLPFCLANNGTLFTSELFRRWNIFITLFFGLISLMIWESKLKLPVRIISIIAINALIILLQTEWCVSGILIILGFHIFRDKPGWRFICFAGSMILLESVQSLLCGGSIFSINATVITQLTAALLAYFLVTRCYNGSKGKHPVFSKWFFYIFYPFHLALIYVFKLFIV